MVDGEFDGWRSEFQTTPSMNPNTNVGLGHAEARRAKATTTGTEKVSAWRMPIPLCRFRANIGQPFTLPVIEGRPSRDVLRSLLDMIMDRIAYLLPEEYRGDYAGDPSTNPVEPDPVAPDPVAPVAAGPSL